MPLAYSRRSQRSVDGRAWHFPKSLAAAAESEATTERLRAKSHRHTLASAKQTTGMDETEAAALAASRETEDLERARKFDERVTSGNYKAGSRIGEELDALEWTCAAWVEE